MRPPQLRALGDAEPKRHKFSPSWRGESQRRSRVSEDLFVVPCEPSSRQHPGGAGWVRILSRAPLGSVGGQAWEWAEWAHTQRFAFAQQQAVYPDCASINRGLCSPYVWG